jgi:hypothetical protein
MAIFPVTLDDVEFFTTLVNPVRSYSSSSSGVTGSIKVFPRSSHIEKEIRPLNNFESSFVNDEDIEIFRNSIAVKAKVSTGSFSNSLHQYLNKVNEQNFSIKKQKRIEVSRFTPTTVFSSNTIKKLNVKNTLMSFYKTHYPTAQWAYTNYNSLNFFNSNAVPSSSVLLYPNINNENIPLHTGYVSGTYALSGGFSFDFRINPRYQLDGNSLTSFKAGTIFHLSSSYALSLITGSRKDENGLPVSFRLLLQLSHSADISPSTAIKGNYPSDLIFLSDDNCLDLNSWHRVVVRWGSNIVNDGTGSFNIDGIDRGTFVVPSGTIMPKTYTSSNDDPKFLCVGNFYEGSNSGLDSQAYFFSDVASKRNGIYQFIDTFGAQDEPENYFFNHPLNAELHEIRIHRNYLNDQEIRDTSNNGISDIEQTKIAFYVPPLFVEKTPIRRAVDGSGGVLQTPFFEIDGSTDDPFNVAMAFGVNGHYINLENFSKDFANNSFPRLHHLSASAIESTTIARSANEFLYDYPTVRRRNLTIMPCDDGDFIPDYRLLSNEIGNKLVDAFGRFDPSFINLDNLLSTSSLLLGSTYDSNEDSTFVDFLTGFTVDNPGLPAGPAVLNEKNKIENLILTDEGSYGPGVQKNVPLSIYQRTKDPSSNQITLFNISNLYYGSKILPGSFQITDNEISGSGGKIKITLKDDGFGNLYRADSKTKHCTWNSVGNVFYNEGVVLIKSPHLYFFGKEQYEMSFRGEQYLHTSKYEILAPSGLLNSSSNPTFAQVETNVSASADPLDTDKFVYISNLNFHDENLNVVAKAVLAQPVIKRENEKLLFKIAFDF